MQTGGSYLCSTQTINEHTCVICISTTDHGQSHIDGGLSLSASLGSHTIAEEIMSLTKQSIWDVFCSVIKVNASMCSLAILFAVRVLNITWTIF
jgi:hypothetical protein